MQTSFYTEEELQSLGFKSCGKNVLISRFVRLYSPQTISIGDNVRIDDFSILSGIIKIGSNIHIAAYCALYGAKEIEIKDYSGLSARVTVYSSMDDFGGDFLIGPIHNPHQTNVTGSKVTFAKYTQVGANSIIFPGVAIGEGTVVGAMSLVKKSLSEWGVYAGIPARKIKERSRNLLHLL